MNKIDVFGGVPLRGKVRIQGSKNASLPILAATILTSGENAFENCPRLSDVQDMLSLLQDIGCAVRRRNDKLIIDAKPANSKRVLQSSAVTAMRSSICLLGAMLGRFGEAAMKYPGGCVIGSRPIDMHVHALEKMGAVFSYRDGIMYAAAKELHGADIIFDKNSVGATENVILAAVLAAGCTTIYGAAKEPEITALCEYLISCGARIQGAGSAVISISGVKQLCGSNYRIPADRIVAGTYLLASIGTGGTVFLEEAPGEQMQSVLELAENLGGSVMRTKEGIYVQGPDRPQAVSVIRTASYPGFPTDLQSFALVVASLAEGVTIIEETIFENRFRIAEELQKAGAELERISEQAIRIFGVDRLKGCALQARELRGGAALVLSGLMAKGCTTVYGTQYIERGYENICRDLRELGARIVSG